MTHVVHESTQPRSTFVGSKPQVHAAENVTYQQVRGTYKYLPFVYRSTGERVNMYPGYTRKEDAVEAVQCLLKNNTATLRATPLEYVNQTQESGS